MVLRIELGGSCAVEEGVTMNRSCRGEQQMGQQQHNEVFYIRDVLVRVRLAESGLPLMQSIIASPHHTAPYH